MDGEITIGTKLSTDKFDRQISDLEKKMKKEEDKKIEIEAKIKDVSSEKIDKQIQNIKDKIEKTTNAPATLKVNADIAKMEKELQQYDLAKQKAKEYKQQLDELEKKRMQMLVANPILAGSKATGEFKQVKNDIQEISKLLQESNRKILEGEPKIDQVSDSLDRLKEKQSSITNKILEYKNALDTLNTQRQQEINSKTEQYKKQLQEINQNISEYKQKIENVKIQKQVADVEKLKQGFNNVGNSLESSIKKVARLALGIFGIRSAYMALRRASSDLASYDQQYATNLEYIRYALTQAVAPVLRYIVNLAAKLLQYINMILNALFGINIFSKGSAESFNKMKAGASGVSKAVKEIKKQLAGFDEINMLTDQSDTGTAGGAGGVGMPSFDLSTFNMKQPKWLQWIIDNKDEILAILAGIAAGLLAIKIGWGGLAGLGIGVAVYGIVQAVQDLIKFITDPSWENFANFLGSLAIAITGVAIAMIAFNATNPVGWILLLIGVIIAVTSAVIKNWDKIKAVLIKVGKWIYDNIISPVKDFFTTLFNAIVEDVKNKWNNIITVISVIAKWVYDNIISPIAEFLKDFFKALLENVKTSWKNIIEVISVVGKWIYDNIIEPVTNFFKEMIEGVVNIAKTAWQDIQDVFKNVGGFFYNKFKDAYDNIKNVFSNIKTFLSGIWESVKDVFSGIGQKIGDIVGNAFKTAVNAVIGAMEKILNSPISAINSLIGTINEVPGINLGYLNTFSLPRMKRGGILNVPNKGTLVGGGTAIAGEAGHEGYIPLTDQQAMSELGREIGKNVLINLTNITTMNGRVIGRELKQVQSEENFAFNN